MELIKSQITGTVFEVSVKEGDEVTSGQTVIILESMKMEIPHEATTNGVVKKIFVQEGDFIEEEALLVELE